MQELKQNKSYIIGIIIASIIGGVASAVDSHTADPIVIYILGTALVALSSNCFIGFLIHLVTAIFTKKVTINGFFICSAIVSVIWALFAILSTLKGMIN